MTFSADEYLDFEQTEHRDLFGGLPGAPVWSALPRIAAYLDEKLNAVAGLPVPGRVHERATIGPRVWIAPGAVVEANAVILGPAWIGAGTVVRSGAYLRQYVIAGDNCVLGNS